MSYVVEIYYLKGRPKELQQRAWNGLAGDAKLGISAQTEVPASPGTQEHSVCAVFSVEPATKEQLYERVGEFSKLLTETTQGAHGLSRGPYAEKAVIGAYFVEPADAAKEVDNLKKDPTRPKQGYASVSDRLKQYGKNVQAFAPERHIPGKKKE